MGEKIENVLTPGAYPGMFKNTVEYAYPGNLPGKPSYVSLRAAVFSNRGPLVMDREGGDAPLPCPLLCFGNGTAAAVAYSSNCGLA